MRGHVLKKYGRFLDKFPMDWENLSGLAYTPLRYFYLADIQMQSFISALEEEFRESHKAQPKDYMEQCYAYCYGFYPLIRACLEVSSKFSDAFQKKIFSQDLKDYRDSATDKIQTIIDIANNYVKHPAENGDKVTWYEPGGLDVSGEFSINEWSTVDNNHFAILTINPIQDIDTVFEHLEKLGELYNEQLSLIE